MTNIEILGFDVAEINKYHRGGSLEYILVDFAIEVKIKGKVVRLWFTKRITAERLVEMARYQIKSISDVVAD